MKDNKSSALRMSAVADGQDELETLPTGEVSAVERWLGRKLLEIADSKTLHLVLWNGETIAISDRPPVAQLFVRDRRALYKLLCNPTLHFGDLFSVGRVKVEGNLVHFLEVAYRTITDAPRVGLLKNLQSRFFNRPRANTLSGSRENIHHHYDIGNAFYELWLDREMQYTCAYFPRSTITLEQAQIAKMDHVCRKLRLKPGDRVVEAGCGWGGLARHMARHYGAKVRSYNISHQQIVHAQERARADGLEDRVEFIEDDYRNIVGEYDVFVSIGMLEHVGLKNYHALGDVIDRCLTEKGRGLIHTIGRNKPDLMNAWTEKRIFPGAYPPTLREMMEIFEPREFSILDVENLRLHYAKTLEHWLTRFNRHEEQVERMFDRNFVRAWRLYLAGSIAAFTTSSLQLFQVVFTRPLNNDLPWSRAHLYPGQ